MPNWTSSQLDAINARNKNILVSAAAGSGKTTVLVERVIQMITDDSSQVDIDQLLIVTFTNAAASEMKNKLLKALNKLVKDNPNNLNAKKQISLLPNASICTIDSFCLNLVRENFFQLGITQDFKLLDDSEALLIEQEAVDSVIESLYDEDKEEFKQLIELLSSSTDDKNFANSIKKIYRFIMSKPFPFEWLNTVSELYNPDISIDDSAFKEYAIEQIRLCVDYAKEIIQNSLDEIMPSDDLYEELRAIVLSDLDVFNSIGDATNKSWDELKQSVDNASFVRMTPKSSTAKPIVMANRSIYRGGRESLLDRDIIPLVSDSSADFSSDCIVLYPVLKQLYGIVLQYHNKLIEIKNEINSYSFSDIEHFAIKLLFSYKDGEIIRTEMAEEYEHNFKEILVDEYQDTNTAQDTLFKMLSNGHNRFMVGDVKQSIYRFRLAMPQIFNSKKNRYSKYDESSSDLSQKIILDNNFRSRKGICDYTNFVFSNLMTRTIGELDYNKDEYLNFGASYYQESNIPSAQIKLVDVPDGKNLVEYEAYQTARMIIDKVNSKELVRDNDTYRPIKYGDFAVLFRSTKDVMPVYARVFTENGIPVASNNRTNLFDNNEVSILMSLFRVIDNPTQDVYLLATLMSSFYGYTADDISLSRVKTPKGSLYNAIINDKERYSLFFDDIDRYQKYASSMTVESFMRQIIFESSYMSVITAMGNAEQRKQNVSKLIDIAKKFDNGSSVGLTAFVRYVDSIVSSKLNVESAEISHTDNNSVLLMSVHKSKGLEFPVCILANSSHQYNFNDLKEQVLLNDEYGIGLKVHNEDGLYRYNSLQYSLIKDMNRSAIMSENLRVLYVAITRAKEQFISIVSCNNIASHINSLSKKLFNSKISPLTAKHIQNDGDFILLTALIHKDAGILREMCDGDIIPAVSDFELNIEMLNHNGVEYDEESIIAEYDEDVVKSIADKLSFKYDRLELAGFSSKRTASSLDEMNVEFQYLTSSKPAFMNKSGLTPAQRGTAMHAFMQYCDYDLARVDIYEEINRLVSIAHLSREQADSLNITKLNNLFTSDFGKRLFMSDEIYREIKVSSFVPVSSLENTSYNDNVLVQGIVDCVFEEDGELVVVDYKTDNVKDEQQLLDRYKNQVGFYKQAIAKTLQKPVKEVMLYSFCLDKCCIYK